MNNKNTTIASKYGETILNQNESIEESKGLRRYKANQITENISRGLLEDKQMDLDGTAHVLLKDTKNKKLMTLKINDYGELENYLSATAYQNLLANQSACKLLDSLLIKETEAGFTNPTIELPLSEYADMTGKRDIKELRKRVKADLEVLKRINVDFYKTIRNGKNAPMDFLNVAIYGGTSGISNGRIIFKFNDDFFKIFKPQSYFTISDVRYLNTNENNNPNSYLIGKYISNQIRTNMKTAYVKKKIKIKIASIYNYCSSLPRYEEIMNTNKKVSEKIIEPFERDLEALNYNWEYELDYKNFAEWKDNSIIIYLIDEQLQGAEQIIDARKKYAKRKKS